jgi:hypothetical protein
LVLGFFFGWNPLAWKLHELGALLSTLQHASNALGIRYWSQTPYRLGPHVVKYSARPIGAAAAVSPSRSPDCLREAMVGQLSRQPAVFEFMIQRQVDPSAMPIEDSTIEGSEDISPFRKVATITSPVQRFDSPDQRALAEHISYTPWHTLPVHEPVGGINRIRLAAYRTVSKLRHELNGVPRREPHSLDIEPWWNSSPKD